MATPASASSCVVNAGNTTVTCNVSIDTSARSGQPAQLALDFADGDGVNGGEGNNTATVSLFSGATLVPPAATAPNVTGTLPGAVVLTDTAFITELLQPITLGATLDFTVVLTRNFFDTPPDSNLNPDNFSFLLLDSSGLPLPTTEPFGANILGFVSASGELVLVDGIQSHDSIYQFFSLQGAAAAVPAPATLTLLGVGVLAGVARLARRRSARL